MITVVKGMPRPTVSAVLASGHPGYQEVDFSDPAAPTITEHRLEEVGHTPCGLRHPTWPNEARGRLLAHLATCELRVQPEGHD